MTLECVASRKEMKSSLFFLLTEGQVESDIKMHFIWQKTAAGEWRVEYLLFLEHDVRVDESLLEVTELAGKVMQCWLNGLGHRDLVLVQDGKLVEEWRYLGLDRRQFGVELFP